MFSFLQNRRISTKLAISGAVGLCLLFALVVSMRGALQKTDAAIDATEDAVRRELVTGQALEALSLLPPLARDLQLAQDVAAVKAVTDQAQAVLATLRRHLAALGSEAAAGGTALAGHLATARTATEGFAAGLDEAAELRRRLLVARDDRLFPQGRAFDFALETVLSGVDLAGLPANAATEVKDRLATVAQSMFELRVATVQYLATLDAAQRQRANRAIATGRPNLHGAMGQELPDRFKDEVGQLGAAIDALGEASQNIFAAQSALIANAREKLGPGQEAAVVAMQRVVALTTAEAKAGMAMAQHEIHLALDTLLWLAGAIALAMLLAGWLTARAIARPLAAMAGATARIARGETARPVDFGPRKDEEGDMARALETLRGVVTQAFAQGQMLEQMPMAVMNEIATTIASAVEEQGAATNEIARSVQQAAAGTAEVNSNIAAVNSAVTQSGGQAGQVLYSATRLTGESARLRQQVDAFLKSVRAA
jgi:methyl-accepting chemotaxis protein